MGANTAEQTRNNFQPGQDDESGRADKLKMCRPPDIYTVAGFQCFIAMSGRDGFEAQPGGKEK
jgi:hypothetical protein